MLWGGADVLRAYIRWMSHLRQGPVDAEAIFLMDEFLHALRADIGQSSSGLDVEHSHTSYFDMLNSF